MHDDEQSNVWFQLLDSVTGEPYKGTRAARVSLSSDADVDAFCDAVKSEYNDSLLKGIAASDLIVYKNKEAFDKRNTQDAKVIILNLITGRAIGRRFIS